MLKEGKNCWRISRADTARLLIDGRDYFRHFRKAVIAAERRILIAAWDIDSHVRLVRDGEEDGYPVKLGELLQTVLKQNKQLHIYVLLWDFSMIYALERDWSPVFNHSDWQRNRRLHLVMDSSHPAGASHHQKIVTIDDALAFAGGIDLSKWRWDTSEHSAVDTRRVDPGGNHYPPFHDVQWMVSGPVVRDLNDLFSQRWEAATGSDLPGGRLSTTSTREIISVSRPDFTDIDIGIARTYINSEKEIAVHESEQLHLDALRQARQLIYIENQYLSSSVFGAAVLKNLKSENGPEIVIVLPRKTGEWLEQMTMDMLRERLLFLFELADKYKRLRVYYPEIPEGKDTVLSVHAKLFTVDDRILKAGSSNLSNRSMTLDSECDLVISTDDDSKISSRIKDIRHRLISEHLGLSPGQFAEAEKRSGSMIQAIESLNKGPRHLEPLRAAIGKEEIKNINAMKIVDPEQPVDAGQLIEHFIGETDRKNQQKYIIQFIAILLALIIITLVWSLTPVGDQITKEQLAVWIGSAHDPEWVHLLMVSLFMLMGTAGVPITLIIGSTGLIFGPVWGFLLAMVISCGSAMLSYLVGHLTGKRFIRSFAGQKINSISKRLAKRGIWTILLLRIIPVAPFAVINLLAGASHIRLRDYVLGTLVGMIPGVLLLSLFFGSLTKFILEMETENILILAGVAGLFFLAVYGVMVAVLRKRSPEHMSGQV